MLEMEPIIRKFVRLPWEVCDGCQNYKDVTQRWTNISSKLTLLTEGCFGDCMRRSFSPWHEIEWSAPSSISSPSL